MFLNKILNKVKDINYTLNEFNEMQTYEDKDLFEIAKEKYEYVIYEKVRANAEYKLRIGELECKLNEEQMNYKDLLIKNELGDNELKNVMDL